MTEKVLCFNLNGFTVAVEPDQIEKILINKHPTRDSFVLETGVEVRSLDSYIVLPEKEESLAENIIFVKDQKDFYGFTVNRIMGYLTLKGTERTGIRQKRSAIRYFVKSDGRLIPVLDLQYITNNENSVSREEIQEIVEFSSGGKEQPGKAKVDKVFEDVSEEEVFRSIEEEINKGKKLQYIESIVESEKRGYVLPLLVNLIIVLFFSAMLAYFLIGNRERVREQSVGATMSGIEEEVIKEIRRRSEEEVREQKKRLEDAKLRLTELQEERDFFLENQENILNEKERKLREDYERRIEEAKKRIMESGASDAEEQFAKEKEKLYNEYLKTQQEARGEIEEIKKQYEEELLQREQRIKQEVAQYSSRIDEIEKKLAEEQAKLKESEAKMQSALLRQQEYMTFRRQLNTVYNKALTFFGSGDYDSGIQELNTLIPILDRARAKGIGDEAELQVEEKLINNILNLAKKEQRRTDLSQIGQKTYEAARALENQGKLEEALPRYFTVYTLVDDSRLREDSFSRAESIMDTIYEKRTQREKLEMEKNAAALFQRAVESKRSRKYDDALQKLEDILFNYAGTPTSKRSLDEIIELNRLKTLMEKESAGSALNQKAQVKMDEASKAYDSGYYSEAFKQYQEVIREYRDSIYVEEALSQMEQISEQLKKLGSTSSTAITGKEANTGVILQMLSEGSLLFSLGSEDGIKAGDTLQVYRREGKAFTVIASLKVYDVNPTISKGKILFYERYPNAGDLVSF